MRNGPEKESSPYLPNGYRLDEFDLLSVRREDGSEVAAFSSTAADPREIERAAGEDLGAGRRVRTRESRRRNVSKRVDVSIDLGALQEAIGGWPGVGEVATRLGLTEQHIRDMLGDGRLKGIRTRVGWIVHPACVERVAREQNGAREEDEEVVEPPKEGVGL